MSKSTKYYKLPADLLSSGLTPRALILYTVLADRAELSRRTGEKYQDSTGTYIIYPVADLCALLGVGERTVRYALSELEDYGLITTRKQGRTRAQKIYVHEVREIATPTPPSDRQEIAGQERQKIAGQERQKIAGLNSNTDNNNTNTNLSSTATGRMILLLGMIDRAARDTGVHLSDKQLNKLLKRLRKHADTIGNLSAYLRTAVTNAAALPDPDEPYAATYDIDEYEHTSVIYEDDEN